MKSKKNIKIHTQKAVFFTDEILDEFSTSTLHFTKFLYKIHEIELRNNEYDDIEFNALVNKEVYNLKSENILFDNIERYNPFFKILDIIFILNSGVEYEFIQTIGKEDSLLFLLEKRVIKYQNNNLYPYHDLISNSYKKHRKKQLYKNIAIDLEKLIVFRNNSNDTELYTILILCGIKYFIKHYKNVLNKIKDSLKNQKRKATCAKTAQVRN